MVQYETIREEISGLSAGPSQMADLPNELLLEFFSYLPLKGLIAARGVSRTWRNLVPLSEIPPARRALLKLYDDIIQTPDFLASRKLIMYSLSRSTSPFDRTAYVAALEKQINGPLPAGMYIQILKLKDLT
jgi:hypothetical protein